MEQKEAQQVSEEEDAYKEKLEQLKEGDGPLDLVDSNFESTQNPLGVNESFKKKEK